MDKLDKYNNDEWFKEVNERMFTFKYKVHNWLKDVEAEQAHSFKNSSKIGSKSTSSKVQEGPRPAVPVVVGKEPWNRRLN